MRFFGKLATAISICFLVLVIFMVIVALGQCDHVDIGRIYEFGSYDSISPHMTRPYCRDCGERFQRQVFEGELIDKSYLKAIVEHSDGVEIVPGEYYTITVISPYGFNKFNKEDLRLTCEVENGDYLVRFSVEFREKFKDQIKSIEEGDEVTFRGRFYDTGCGFTDAELIGFKAVE